MGAYSTRYASPAPARRTTSCDLLRDRVLVLVLMLDTGVISDTPV